MNILLTSVGRRNYIVKYFKDALQGMGRVICINSLENTSGMFTGDKFYTAPEIASNEYIPFLLKICEKENIEIIISLFDQDLLKLAKNKSLFESKNIKVVISDEKVVKLTFDKYEFSKFINKIQLKAPITLKRDEFQNHFRFPLILKPRWGTGSIATEVVKNEKDFSIYYEYLKKKLDNSYLKNTSVYNEVNEIIIQEYIQGIEFHLDIINNLDGNYITTFPKTKLGMRAGETDGAITIEDAELMRLGEIIGKELKHIGVLDLDVIRNSNNEDYIIDANPRFGGGYPFAHTAGANIPAAIISWVLNKRVNPDWLRMQSGIVSVKGIELLSKKY